MSWERTAYVGQHVVCIDNSGPLESLKGEIAPTIGIVYTIRRIEYVESWDKTGILLAEIINPRFDTSIGLMERLMPSEWFRPVDETKLDVFRTLLKPVDEETKRKILEDA
jgi:hypothetical protein